MPTVTYGPVPKKRAMRLLEALLTFVNDEVDGRDPNLKFCWKEDRNRPKLLVETTLKDLASLTERDRYEEELTTEHIRMALKAHMKDFLGILEDNRPQKQGQPKWHFTLTLWSKDKGKNLEEFDREWERRRPARGKEQEIKNPDSSASVEDRHLGRIPRRLHMVEEVKADTSSLDFLTKCLNHPLVVITQQFGDRTNIDTGGGDYAGRDLFK